MGFTAPRKALLRGPVFPSLQGNYEVIQLKILIYRIFLLFFLDCRVASLLAMTVQISTQAMPARNDDSVLMQQGLQNEKEIHFLNFALLIAIEHLDLQSSLLVALHLLNRYHNDH
ncbi:MAG: hypothetical protein RCG16_00670 [Rickettsia hoogstraalii]